MRTARTLLAVIGTGVLLTSSLVYSQTLADIARQEKSAKKSKRVYTSEDMAPAKEEPVVVAAPPATKEKASAASKRKSAEEAAKAAKAAEEAAALAKDKVTLEETFTALDVAEREEDAARVSAAEITGNPEATAAQKSSAQSSVEAATARRVEVEKKAQEFRTKVKAATKPEQPAPASQPPPE